MKEAIKTQNIEGLFRVLNREFVGGLEEISNLRADLDHRGIHSLLQMLDCGRDEWRLIVPEASK